MQPLLSPHGYKATDLQLLRYTFHSFYELKTELVKHKEVLLTELTLKVIVQGKHNFSSTHFLFQGIGNKHN